jgi:hypothetical protein
MVTLLVLMLVAAFYCTLLMLPLVAAFYSILLLLLVATFCVLRLLSLFISPSHPTISFVPLYSYPTSYNSIF